MNRFHHLDCSSGKHGALIPLGCLEKLTIVWLLYLRLISTCIVQVKASCHSILSVLLGNLITLCLERDQILIKNVLKIFQYT